MSAIDIKIFYAVFKLLKQKKDITVSSLAKESDIDRNSIYYRMGKVD